MSEPSGNFELARKLPIKYFFRKFKIKIIKKICQAFLNDTKQTNCRKIREKSFVLAFLYNF